MVKSLVNIQPITEPRADMGPDVKYLLCVPPRNPPALKFELIKKFKFDVNETYSSIKGFRLSALFNTYTKTIKI